MEEGLQAGLFSTLMGFESNSLTFRLSLSLPLSFPLTPPPPIHLPAFSSSLDITMAFINRVIASDTGCNVFTNFTSFSQYLECYVPQAFKKWNAFRIVS